MKRLLILALIVCLVLSVCACASSDAPTNDPTTAPTGAPTSPTSLNNPTNPTNDPLDYPNEPPLEMKVEGVWEKENEYFCLIPNGITYYYGYDFDEGIHEVKEYSWELNGNILRVFDFDTEYFAVDIEVQDVATRICAMQRFELDTFDPVGVWECEDSSVEFFADNGDGWGPSGMCNNEEDFYWTQDGYCINVDMKGDSITFYILGDCLFSIYEWIYNRA